VLTFPQNKATSGLKPYQSILSERLKAVHLRPVFAGYYRDFFQKIYAAAVAQSFLQGHEHEDSLCWPVKNFSPGKGQILNGAVLTHRHASLHPRPLRRASNA